MKRFFCFLFMFMVCSVNAADDTFAREYFSKFSAAVKIIDHQLKLVAENNVYPTQDSVLYANEALKPIEMFFSTFGERSDPMVSVLMTSLDQLRLSLNVYYDLGKSTKSAYAQPLPSSLQTKFNKTFTGLTQNYILNIGMCLKMYMQMVLYETPEKYTKFFPDNVMKNHELFMTQATETLQNFYLFKFMPSLDLSRDPSEQIFLSVIYKAFKSFSFLIT